MKKTINSFVLRAGRLSPRQAYGLEQALPTYALPMQDYPWDLCGIFGREAETIVEIGFGMGASFLEMARAAPHLNFIGIEVHKAGIGALAASLEDEGLTNVRIAPFDAKVVFQQCLSDAVLAGVQIFFPDPWPKKRHHKRRLIQTDFINSLLVKIKPGGFVHCATDWQDYADWMLNVFSQHPGLINDASDGGFYPRPSLRPLTKFEKRGVLLGHGVWDLIFRTVI